MARSATRIRSAILLAMGTVVSVGRAEPPAAPSPRAEAIDVTPLMLSAESWTSSEVAALTRFLKSPEFVYAPAATGQLHHLSGRPLLALGSQYGRVLQAGESTSRGLYWNPGNEPAVVRAGNAAEPFSLPPGAMIIVGEAFVQANDQALKAAGGDVFLHVTMTERVSVSCDPGTFACCKRNPDGTMTATCIPDEEHAHHDCDAGGLGSIACSIVD